MLRRASFGITIPQRRGEGIVQFAITQKRRIGFERLREFEPRTVSVYDIKPATG
jgi:hypothetical protein